MDSYRLVNQDIRDNAIQALLAVTLDGHTTMMLRDTDTRSNRQLALLWKLFRFIASSGKGDADNAEDVNVSCKWRFLRPILISGDTMYAEIYATVSERYASEPDMMKFITAKLFHFGDLSVSQMSDCLNQIIGYYGSHGVYLPIHGEEDLLSVHRGSHKAKPKQSQADEREKQPAQPHVESGVSFAGIAEMINVTETQNEIDSAMTHVSRLPEDQRSELQSLADAKSKAFDEA